MLVSIIGENTFKVGDRVLEVGDEIKLEDVPPVEIPGFGSMPATQLQTKLGELNEWIKRTKQDLLQQLHLHNEAYNDEIALLCWRYVNAHRDWAFFVDLLFKSVEKHLGGGPPLQIDPNTGKITVRTLKQDPREAHAENLNWTRAMVARQVQFQRYDGVRIVVKDLYDEEANDAVFDIDLLAKVGVPCLRMPKDAKGVNPVLGNSLAKDAVVALANAGVKAFAELQAMSPVCLVWITEEGPIFCDLKEKIIPQQGMKPLPLPVVIQQVAQTLGNATTVGLLLFGDLSHISEGKRGLVACSVDQDGFEYHCALAAEGDAFTMLSSGDGMKIEDNLAGVVKGLVKKEGEEEKK